MRVRLSLFLLSVWTSTALAVVAPATAQRIVTQWWGTTQTVPTDDAFFVLPLGGDVDGDGVPDLLFISPNLNLGGATMVGRLTVVSGQTNVVLFDRRGDGPGAALGTLPPLRLPWSHPPDGTADKRVDVPLSYSEGGRFVSGLLDGQTFEMIDSFTSNDLYQFAGDLDGDGVADRLVGDRDASPSPSLLSAGRVVAYSGKDGRVIYSLWGSRIDQGFGAAIHPATDLDGDRVNDFFVVSKSGLNEAYSNTLIQLFSGAPGTEITRIIPITQSYGDIISAKHDLDGDGIPDLVVNDRGIRVSRSYGRVRAFAGPTFQRQLFDITRHENVINPLGFYFETCRDIDGDGCDDLVVGSTHSSAPFTLAYTVISGRDQSTLFALVQRPTFESIMTAQAAHGDYNNDDFPDVIVNAHEMSPNRRRADLRSGAPDGVDVLGRACLDASGHTPRIGASYKPEPGRPFHVNLSRVAPGQSAWLILGTSSTTYAGLPLPLDLGPIGLPGCDLSVSADMTLPVTTTGVNGIGRAVVPLAIPNDSGLRGAVFHAQWLVLGRGGVGSAGTTTRALKVTIQ